MLGINSLKQVGSGAIVEIHKEYLVFDANVGIIFFFISKRHHGSFLKRQLAKP